MFINNFDPVAIQIFSIEIRWYSLAYIFGILIGWLYCKKILIKDKNISKLFDDLISYLIIGIILGGRLGYVIFYNLEYFSSNPIEILMIWQGGMSFHGGLLGVLASTIIYAKKHNLNKFIFLDLIAGSAPIGIFLSKTIFTAGNFSIFFFLRIAFKLFITRSSLPKSFLVPDIS